MSSDCSKCLWKRIKGHSGHCYMFVDECFPCSKYEEVEELIKRCKAGVQILPKGDWQFGLMLEIDRNWDNGFFCELALFKLRLWFGKSFRD